MKKKLLTLSTVLALLLTLTACGAASKETYAAAPSSPAAGADTNFKAEEEYYGGDMGMAVTESTADSAGAVSGQKLIRTASLEMETLEFETTTASLTTLVADMGGYIENSSLRNRGSGYRYASYVVRIPADRYEEFLNQAGSLCHETWRSTSQEDISELYYDTQGRLKTQQIKLERLQDLLSQAVTMEDIITIESAISETEMLIDSYSGTLRHYDGKVDYATIDISINEVYKYSNTEEAPTTFGQRMGNAFTQGWANFLDALEDLAVSFAYSWMWWLLLGGLAVVLVRVVRRKERRFRLPSLRRRKKNDDNGGES